MSSYRAAYFCVAWPEPDCLVQTTISLRRIARRRNQNLRRWTGQLDGWKRVLENPRTQSWRQLRASSHDKRVTSNVATVPHHELASLLNSVCSPTQAHKRDKSLIRVNSNISQPPLCTDCPSLRLSISRTKTRLPASTIVSCSSSAPQIVLH